MPRAGRALILGLALLASYAAAREAESSEEFDRLEASLPSEADTAPASQWSGPTMRFRGRVYGNHETIDPPDPAVNGSATNDFDIRRADLTVTGSLTDALAYRFKGEFKTGELETRDLEIGFDAGFAVVKIGQIGPIDELTVPAYREFMEGAALEDAFIANNQTGIFVRRATEHWTFATGAFKGAIDPDNAEKGRTYAGRVTYTPPHPEGRQLHLGGYVSWRKGNSGEPSYGYSARSLLRTGERFVDTDDVADEDMLFGMELAGSVGSVALESQCAVVRASVVSPSESVSHFDGCYAGVSWFFTGETRNYRNGAYSQVDVLAPVFDGGPGAWQAGVRYDTVDLNDGSISGGKQKGWAFVLNWFLSDQFWLATNYSRTDLEYGDAMTDTTDGVAVRLHFQIRR